jgi:hypothetical protein
MEREPTSAAGKASMFLTTEHFTLATARASSVNEINGRLQLYAATLSSSIVGLALVAQISRVGPVFEAFALTLLPTNYVLGLATIGRLLQLWEEWFAASQGMNRIRRYYVEQAPEVGPYLTMPTTDDPMHTLSGVGIRPRAAWGGFVTAPAVVAIVNAAVAGVLGVVVGDMLSRSNAALAVVLGTAAFAGSLSVTFWLGTRWIRRRMAEADVRFGHQTD